MKKSVRKTAAQSVRLPVGLKVIAASVGLALSQMALADSGVVADSWLGNAMNPRAVYNFNFKDPDGVGQNENARSPSGMVLYDPDLVQHWSKAGDSGWVYRGSIEAGGISTGGDDKRRGFIRYKDLSDGIYLNNVHVEAENQQSGNYFEAFAGGLGNDDQYAAIRFGRYNDWRVKTFYNETRHVFSTNWRSIYANDGSNNLKLKSPLVPGGFTTPGGATADTPANLEAKIAGVLANTSDGEISLLRKKGGARLDMNLGEKWKVFASYTNEKRDGARPFAAIGAGNFTVEMAEPIDYDTHDFLGGLEFADDLNALKLTLNANLFRNHNDMMLYQNPWNGGVGTTGFMDLYPDNEYYNAKGEYARSFPDFYKSRLTAVVSWASSRQNDKLNPGTMQGSNGALAPATLQAGYADWNTMGSLYKGHADAKIDTTLVDLAFALKPVDALNIKLRGRYFETDNQTTWNNCNPNARYTASNPNAAALGLDPNALTYNGCTGVWGRIQNNAVPATNALLANSAAGSPLFWTNIPWDRKEALGSFSADYRLSNYSSVNGSLEYEQVERSYREVDKTKEWKGKVGYTNRALLEDTNGTLRASFEYDHKTGSNYNILNAYKDSAAGAILSANGYIPAAGSNLLNWMSSLGGGNVANPLGQMMDQADRNQQILNLRYGYIITPEVDVGVNFQLKRVDYPNSDYGVRKQSQDSVNFDLNYQPARDTSFYAFYSFQQGKQKMRDSLITLPTGVTVAAALGGCAADGLHNYAWYLNQLGTGSANDLLKCVADGYNPAGAYDVSSDDTSQVLGFGFRHSFGKLMLDAQYTYTDTRSQSSYGWVNPAAAAAMPATSTATGASISTTNQTAMKSGGGKLPDMRYVANSLQLNLVYPVTKEVNARLMYLYETGSYSNWQYAATGVVLTGATLNAASVISDGGDQSYRAHLLGLFFNVNF
ncbi:MAG: MtrB/PioB family outer membrane beta-barrel protein [Azonexus sp.]|nr:MtrB/PioB family outer membrane beta-barrel protein [Azonexus sp.]